MTTPREDHSLATSPPGGLAADVPHMSLEEFRLYGKRLVDWVADYLETLGDRDVTSHMRPGEVRAKLGTRAPDRGEDFEDVLRDLDDVIMPGITHWQHPGWFAYFPASTSPASILGELVSAGLGVQGMLWSTSPSVTELESTVLDWLVDLLGLPPTWRVDTGPGGGVLQMSASDSTHTSLVVARHRMTGAGNATDDLVAYGSEQAHSSVEKGARIAGFRHIRAVPTGTGHAMSVDALRSQIAADRAEGLVPAWVCSTVGTTGTTAVDPVEDIAELVAGRLWHHVDAAYAGTAMVLPELRPLQAGLERVDSYTTNPHKWLLTNFDCSAFWVADRATLVETLSIVPPYLRNAATESGDVIDYRDWHVPLGRRFRALKLWFVLRTYGAQGLRGHIHRHLRWAAELDSRVRAHPRLEPIAVTRFALVSFRHVAGDEATDLLAETINDTGRAFVTPSTVDGRRFIRVSIGSSTTTWQHVEDLWSLIHQHA